MATVVTLMMSTILLVVIMAIGPLKVDGNFGNLRPSNGHRRDAGTWPVINTISNSTCGICLYGYAATVAELAYCSTINARPFTLCENCVQTYANSSATYAAMMKAVDYDGTPCQDVLLKSDRIQVVGQLNAAMSSIWELAQCNYCFGETVDVKGDVVYVLSNNTVAFDELINETFACIERYTNNTFDIEQYGEDNRAGNVSNVCTQCGPYYKNLNNMYNTMVTSADNLCMDTIDKMNLTRMIWSDRLRCVNHHNTAWAVVLSTLIISSLPIAFYVALYLQADRQEHCVIPQKRLLSRYGATVTF